MLSIPPGNSGGVFHYKSHRKGNTKSASVLQQYRQLADHMATQITASFQSRTDFLTTAARLYKYPYHEQLMIYAQRPEATACADYELWNKRMGRYVRRGAKGIALIDNSGDNPKLKYVFDVADTRSTERSRSPYLWEYRPEHEQAVSAALGEQFAVPNDGSITEQLEQIWYMSHDMSEKAMKAGHMSIVRSLRGGFPEETEKLIVFLSEPESYQAIMRQVYAFRDACNADKGMMRFQMYHPNKLIRPLEEYTLPRREYVSEMAELPAAKGFITEDEINEHLTGGSNFSGSKGRIYAFYQTPHTAKEKLDFLKNEYGIGGGNNALSRNFMSHVWTDGKGIHNVVQGLNQQRQHQRQRHRDHQFRNGHHAHFILLFHNTSSQSSSSPGKPSPRLHRCFL